MEIIFCNIFCAEDKHRRVWHTKNLQQNYFHRWKFILHKNYFLQKNIFYKNNFRVKKFLLSCILQKIYFLKFHLKNASFLSFSLVVLTSEKTQKLKKSARSQNRHILRKWPILSKKWDFSDLAQSPKMLKTPKNGKNDQKWGFWISGRDGPKRQAAARAVGSLI